MGSEQFRLKQQHSVFARITQRFLESDAAVVGAIFLKFQLIDKKEKCFALINCDVKAHVFAFILELKRIRDRWLTGIRVFFF